MAGLGRRWLSLCPFSVTERDVSAGTFSNSIFSLKRLFVGKKSSFHFFVFHYLNYSVFVALTSHMENYHTLFSPCFVDGETEAQRTEVTQNR